MEAARIQYAPVDPQERRRLRFRQFLRRFAPLLILLAMSPVLWKCGTTAWRRSQILYWQRRAMNYSQPQGRIVLDLSLTGYGKGSQEWQRLNQEFSPPGRLPAATLFLHERKNAKGESRLVAVEHSPSLAWITVIAPGSMIHEPKEVYEAQVSLIDFTMAGYKRGMKCLAFAGQPDPADPSHFTIGCQIGEKQYTIEGYLGDDDTVTFSTRP